jgi:hypothetical protein
MYDQRQSRQRHRAFACCATNAIVALRVARRIASRHCVSHGLRSILTASQVRTTSWIERMRAPPHTYPRQDPAAASRCRPAALAPFSCTPEHGRHRRSKLKACGGSPPPVCRIYVNAATHLRGREDEPWPPWPWLCVMPRQKTPIDALSPSRRSLSTRAQVKFCQAAKSMVARCCCRRGRSALPPPQVGGPPRCAARF